MPKSTTNSFILALPLVVKSADERILLGRLDAGRKLFNAALSDALKRLDAMRQSEDWQAARLLPKGKPRTDAFRACNIRFDFSEYALHAAAIQHKNAAGWSDRLGANETQKVATRVWRAVQEHAFGGRGRPRFKGRVRPLHSLEGKTNVTGLRWKADIGCVVWNGIYLPARLPSEVQDPYLAEALRARTKYCRIVWRMIRGQRRWFAQLVQEGVAPAKYTFANATGAVVGLDIGPSSIAVIGDDAVALEKFAPSVEQPWKEIRRLQRALDRSRRAVNPANYHPDDTARRGAKAWKKSSRYQRLQSRLAETERKLAAARKRDHGDLANRILSLGNIVQTEQLSYLALQKCFGRSAKVRAPGAFISLLSRKAESAGGKLVELDTRRLRMSQYDHVSGVCAKKPLSQRWHPLGARTTLVQRDCYSAFLAKFAGESGHNPSRLEQGWAAAEPLLRRAGLCMDPSANGKAPAFPTVSLPSERIARRREPAGVFSQAAATRKRESCLEPRL